MAKDQELLQAVKSSDLNAFRKIAAKIKAAKSKKGGKKYNVNIQDEDGFTATHHASLTGSSEVVLTLIELECDVNAKDKKGMTPLHLAAWSGKVEVARLLVESGAEVDSCCENGDTPLILACQHGNSDVAEVLLDRKCLSLTVNNNGETALDLACRYGHVHAVELLLSSREVRSALANGEARKTDPPLHLASKTGHMEIVRMLLEADADINLVTSNGTCLHEAALYGKTEVVKFLFDWGIDANIRNDEGHTALDVVNLFTSSKASAEIKQLLKDAADADTTVYAKAVRDHFNMLDSTALSFKAGETIIVLEQHQNERWKGKVISGDKEKVGYFPENFVRLTTPRKGSSAKKSPKLKEAGVLPVGSYQMVALPSEPPSGFQRNSPRLSSFGKKVPRRGGDEDEEQNPSPLPKKALFEPVLPPKGLKAKKGSVKLASGPGLQYVEVEVDKAPMSPPQASNAAANQTNSKTQYAEVRLPGPNGNVEEVDECEDLPQLPHKEKKKPSVSNEMEDIWVRNPANPPPSLPPKTRAPSKDDTPTGVPESNQSPFKSGRPPAALPQDIYPVGKSSPEGQTSPACQTGLEVTEQPSRRVASPELSRKGYEDMNLSLVSGERAMPPPSPEDIWKPQPWNVREQPKQQLAYENVQLPNRGKPTSDMQSMIISDVDQPGEGEDGYVIVNTPSSKTTDARGYENVTPGAVTPVKYNWDNISSDVNYVPMTGGVSADAAQTARTSNQAPEQGDKETNLSGESKDGMDYEMMKSCAVSVNHQYVNINRHGDAGNPSEAAGQIPLKMRDYNALFDWLEKFKLTIYIDNFVKGGFDMTSVLGITAEDLTAINVTKTFHRKKILSESAKLEGTTVFPKEKPKDIMTWLRLIGLEQYIPEFLDGGFDDMDFLQDMTSEDLVAIGVTKPGHQRKIWMAVNALKEADENENVLESVEEEELTPQERKGYLETCLDGEDSGVSTDEVEPSELISESAPTEEERMEFSRAALAARENVNEEPFVEDSSSAESEIPETTTQQVLKEEIPHENVDQEQLKTSVSQDLCSEVLQTSGDGVNLSAQRTDSQEKDNDKKEADTSFRLHKENAISLPDSEDDEPPPRPPPPMEDIDLPRHVADSNKNEIDYNGPKMAVKDLASKENDRIRTFSLDSTFQRPKKPAPPAVKPKSFKKAPPPKVPPKPRKAASFTAGYIERSSGEESCGDRSPTKSLSPVDRRSSTGSGPYCWPSPPGVRQTGNGNGSVRSRSSSASSHSSVDSLIEEFEERKKSFERPGRKISAPERLNTSYEYRGGLRKSQADAARADGELDEQIKQILRNRSREDLSETSPIDWLKT
ncbi:uncharacterized protein LOC144632388 isoform X3 [Oculina patagonica]